MHTDYSKTNALLLIIAVCLVLIGGYSVFVFSVLPAVNLNLTGDVEQMLPGQDGRPLVRVRNLLLLLGTISVAIWFAVAARRRQCLAALTAVGTITFCCGTIIAALSALHLVAVVGLALSGKGSGPGGTFVYDFRFYALVQLGLLLIAGAVVYFIQARWLTRGEPHAWKATLWVTVALLAVNVPLMPIQGFAIGFSVLLFLNLAALVATRKRFHLSGARR